MKDTFSVFISCKRTDAEKKSFGIDSSAKEETDGWRGARERRC